MTAHPDPTNFAYSDASTKSAMVSLHPNVTEQFWGYELCMNETAFSIATVTRALAGFLALVCLIAALGVWLVPRQALFGSEVFSTTLASVLLGCLALMCANTARRGGQVRVQVDTVRGEIREVAAAGFGRVEVLASYGMDAVRDVRLVESQIDKGFAQVHVEIEGFGPVPLADGALAPLRLLSHRISADCGLETGGKRTAEWTGPLAG